MKTSSLLKLIIGCVVVAGLVLGCVSVGHPNLVAARQFVEQAIDKVSAAQKANDYDMQGHAAKAKRLMEQAIQEIQLAGEAANGN
jgi:outer membrane murein-binding lipoprotein Lpp